MSLFSRLLPRKPSLDANLLQRLAAWHELPAPDLHAPLDQSRLVVVDVETSGLSLARDHLIAIGAIAIRGGEIQLNESLEIVLRQDDASSKDNILVHGIGGAAQTNGVPPAEGLLGFLEYLGKSPLIAFHVTFDETMIKRAMRQYLGLNFKNPWLDLAYAMPALHPELSNRHRSLDDWLNHFGIRNFARHTALADAYATAQLGLIALDKAHQRNIPHLHGLQKLEKAQRWVEQAH